MILIPVVAAWLASRPSDSVQLARLRQVTRSSAADLWPTFSPDGSQIAFSSNRSGGFEIYVQSLAAGSVEQQITRDGQENIQPAWSPDGRYLAYVPRQRGGIAIVPVSGGASRPLTDHGDSPAWSADGKFIAFRSCSLDMNPAMETTGMAETTIWMMAADGTGKRALTRVGWPPGGHNFPRWTADSRRVIFASGTPPFSDASRWPHSKPMIAPGLLLSRPWSIDVRTGRLEEIRIDSPSVRSPVLSADGAHLYFAGAGGSEPGLWHARMRGVRADPAEILVPAGGPTPRDPALAPDGQRIVFSQQTGESAIWSVPMSSDGTPAGEPRPIIQDRNFRNTEPVFSANGKYLAFSSIRQGGEWAVNLANTDGTNQRPVTNPEQVSGRPSWKGQSDVLGFRVIRGGDWSYWVLPAGGAAARLQMKLDIEHADRLSFSPDGSRIAAHVTTPLGLQIVVEDLTAHAITRMTPADQDFGFPAWSPNGRWLKVQHRVGGRNYLAYMPAHGGTIQRLETGMTQTLGAGWSPDSDKLLFAGLTGGVWNIYWVSRSTGEVRKLTNFTSHSAFVRYPAWSPDGSQIVFEHNSLSANVYLADLK